jgi:hypothetical protein
MGDSFRIFHIFQRAIHRPPGIGDQLEHVSAGQRHTVQYQRAVTALNAGDRDGVLDSAARDKPEPPTRDPEVVGVSGDRIRLPAREAAPINLVWPLDRHVQSTFQAPSRATWAIT